MMCRKEIRRCQNRGLPLPQSAWVRIPTKSAFRQAFNRVVGQYSEFKTTFHNLVADNDLVMCHLSHRVVHRGKDWGEQAR
jgi:hypothetical protein